MEEDQVQLQSLGCFGTIKESFKIVFSWKRIFTLITLTLILPLSFILLAQIPLSNLLSCNNNTNNIQTSHNFCKKFDNSQRQNLLRLFNIIYGNILVTLNLLSFAAVAYTIACIFAARQTTFKKVISVVPRVWKRLRVTYRWIYAILYVYILVGVGVLTLLVVFLPLSKFLLVFTLVILVYFAGLLYIGPVSQLAIVVSILEEKHGLEAVIKSRNLIKGKMRLAVGTFFLYGLFGPVTILLIELVILKWSHNLAVAIPVAILCLMFLSVVNLFGLVAQTIVYFVCKSYHNEIIDKSSLSIHLEEYVGLNRSRDVRLEQSRV